MLIARSKPYFMDLPRVRSSNFHCRNIGAIAGDSRKRTRFETEESKELGAEVSGKRFLLNDSDDESAVLLPSDIEKYVTKYIKKHVSDKTTIEKILEYCPLKEFVKPPSIDIYRKELLQSSKSSKGGFLSLEYSNLDESSF